MLKEGDSFPDFSLNDNSGKTVTLSDLKGKKAILYFYPKDDTPGCTAEACDFRDAMPNFEGIQIFGISPDSEKSHQKFVDKFNLNFPLLADKDHHLADAVGVWVEKSMYGKKYMGVARTTFLLDENGTVAKVWENVKPAAHAREILDAVK